MIQASCQGRLTVLGGQLPGEVNERDGLVVELSQGPKVLVLTLGREGVYRLVAIVEVGEQRVRTWRGPVSHADVCAMSVASALTQVVLLDVRFSRKPRLWWQPSVGSGPSVESGKLTDMPCFLA